MTFINYVANGMGGQSMYLLYLASQKLIPATISITADTGWENDCDLSDGTKTNAKEFYEKHIESFGAQWNIPTYFVRTLDRYKNPLPSIPEYLREKVAMGRPQANPVPMFGSQKGRLKQSCTDKWKISAMKQQLRRLGAITARSAQGIHYGEASRRVRGQWIADEGGFSIYRQTKLDKEKGLIHVDKWLTHYYPLVDLKMDREAIKQELDRLGIPYLVSSECAGCPHADPWRWLRRTPETIESVADIESMYDGEFFLTDKRIPLREAIQQMKDKIRNEPLLFTDFADCKTGYCGT